MMGWGDSSAGKSRLPCKQDDMYLKPRIYKKSYMTVYIYNPNTIEVETGRCLGLTGQSSLFGVPGQ